MFSDNKGTPPDNAIAIIGMSGRFPDAKNIDEFWHNIRSGISSIRQFTDQELLAAGADAEALKQPNYVKAGVTLPGIELFDAQFFGFSPREAEVMDPQQRLFLECAQEALECAGYDPNTYQGLIGVFAGKGGNSYLVEHLVPNRASINTLQASTGNDSDALASTVAYKLNLKGPSIAIQTFCSTSLVAIHFACQSLLNYESDMTLAGGAAIQIPHGTGYLYEEGSIYSPDGTCHALDANAQGSVMGSGAGIVVLKRLADALDDGDQIYALIRGSAVNNDGTLRVSYTAPGLDGQTEVIAEAIGNADVPAESISYIETHGTGTKLGDAVELSAMKNAFALSTTKQQFCAIGSAKPNVGHLDRASGVTGLIKTIQALQHKVLPPSLNFTRANPDVQLEQSPFYVNTQLQEWSNEDGPRRAGVSSFGLGGTNAHVIVEEAPERQPGSASRTWQLLLLSARTESALEAATTNLQNYLQQHPTAELADIAYTLQVGRATYNYRRAIVCQSSADAVQILETKQTPIRQETLRGRGVAFLLSGLEEPAVGTAQELYSTEPAFQAAIDTCSQIVQERFQLDLLAALYPECQTRQRGGHLSRKHRHGNAKAPEAMADPLLAQMALFAIGYALAQLCQSWGIQPQAMLGYDLGEYIAACLAEVLSLEDALKLTMYRAQLAVRLPAGAMMIASLSPETAEPYLNEQITLAATHRPNSCVLSGSDEALDLLASQLSGQGISCQMLPTRYAWHSSQLAAVCTEFRTFVQSLQLQAPTTAYISNVTGNWITAEQAMDPDYWVQLLCQPIRFGNGVARLLQETDNLLLEVGCGPFLRTISAQHPACPKDRLDCVLATLPNTADTAQANMVAMLGGLWAAGTFIDWSAFYGREQRQRLALPTYPFERQRYWLETRKALYEEQVKHPTDDDWEKLPDLADWFNIPSWKRLPIPVGGSTSSHGSWLIFADEQGVGQALIEQLRAHGEDVVAVMPGSGFQQQGSNAYCVRVDVRGDYTRLFQALQADDKTPEHIVQLWNVAPIQPATQQVRPEQGLVPVLALTQAIADSACTQCALTFIVNGLWRILGTEQVQAEKACMLGPTRVIPQEYSNITCRCIDIVLPEHGGVATQLVEQLQQELLSASTDVVLAYREQSRWVQTFEAMPLPGSPQPLSPFRQKGIYLITGGLGGIGLATADYLARNVQARLVLTSRSGLPEREQWATILQTTGSEKGTGRMIRQVLDLEKHGAQVLTCAVNVADEQGMAQVIARAQATFGPLNGVIHAAGIPASGLIQQKAAEDARRVLQPKIQGTQVLERVLADVPLDFLVLFSSTSSVTGGGPGQIDYCAANAYLDAHAQQHSSRQRKTVAINWGEWQWDAWEDGLQGYPKDVQEYFKKRRASVGISFDEGMEALTRILTQSLSQVIVSTTDFQRVVTNSKHFSVSTVLEKFHDLHQADSKHQRPVLANDYVAPGTEAEGKLVTIWEELLGLEQVGIHDNFFELGGNSLMGTQLIARFRKAFQANLPLSLVYEALTVAEQAQTIHRLLDEPHKSSADSRNAQSAVSVR
ncbi:polyketide synthase [Dictyobacter alpinus]|uniref:Phenolphthiocerol/phthiocerol polyketide synthase subunit E n=1 Tax=Dictyobacter alpinus TaxID=2014873 RepID=A0A402BIW9_9CHLR|nr:type I polyketide synthase [Dictyobacter alpinus]GCE31289.1 polyketide synthase [Dictyobacter alpinus]